MGREFAPEPPAPRREPSRDLAAPARPRHPTNQATQALLRGGKPLAPSLRAFFESRLGQDLGHVRVHRDAEAAAAVEALDARALAVGTHVAVDPREYAPDTPEGRHLLAHELAHVGQSRGRADRIRRQPRRSAPTSDPNLLAPAPPAGAAISRAEFERVLRRRFAVQRIATGTEEEQRSLLTPRGGTPPQGITLPEWQSWDPGPSSPVYDLILAGLEETATSLGGVPEVREILFFRINYVVGPSGVGVPDRDTGASFGAGHLTIYARAVTGAKGLPTGRSTAAGTYPSVVAVLAPGPTETAGAPVPLPTPGQHTRRVVTHELGHGVTEAAMAAGPQIFARYQRAVGWTTGGTARLFDIGQPAVRQALTSGTPPPPTFEITPDTWNAPAWIEQPISRYMVEGGPGEDFAEAIMAFVHEPALLVARSPARFRFIEAHRAQWLPFLTRLPQIGDFPVPRGDSAPA
jgi:hypothetical protein